MNRDLVTVLLCDVGDEAPGPGIILEDEGADDRDVDLPTRREF